MSLKSLIFLRHPGFTERERRTAFYAEQLFKLCLIYRCSTRSEYRFYHILRCDYTMFAAQYAF
jgi:hypothetical protein